MIMNILIGVCLAYLTIEYFFNKREIKNLKHNSILDWNTKAELESKIHFWKTRCEEFNLDKAILHERNLRKRFEKLYHKSLDELDKLKDKRQFNGTKHKQRNERTNNNRKTD